METYNYLEHVESDVRDYIKFNVNMKGEKSRSALEEKLYDLLFVSDSVTGNGSGSYYCNAWKAEEAICHNLELLAEACNEFGSIDILKEGAEACDVTIRCYLLGQAIDNVLDEYEFEED